MNDKVLSALFLVAFAIILFIFSFIGYVLGTFAQMGNKKGLICKLSGFLLTFACIYYFFNKETKYVVVGWSFTFVPVLLTTFYFFLAFFKRQKTK